MTFDQKTSLRLVGEALGLAHSLSDIAPIIVRSVYMIDGSLTVEVLATSDDPIRLRGQAASVMGDLSGLDPADLFPTLEFSQFAVRLVDKRGHDVFWVISSPQGRNVRRRGCSPLAGEQHRPGQHTRLPAGSSRPTHRTTRSSLTRPPALPLEPRTRQPILVVRSYEHSGQRPSQEGRERRRGRTRR